MLSWSCVFFDDVYKGSFSVFLSFFLTLSLFVTESVLGTRADALRKKSLT